MTSSAPAVIKTHKYAYMYIYIQKEKNKWGEGQYTQGVAQVWQFDRPPSLPLSSSLRQVLVWSSSFPHVKCNYCNCISLSLFSFTFVFFFLDILMVWSLAIFLFLRFAAKHHQEDKNGIKVEKAKEKKRKRGWKKRGQRCCFPRSIVRPAWSVLGRSGPQLGLSRCLKQLRGWARRLSTRPLLGRVLPVQLK